LDTTKYEVARAASVYDVAIFNDVSCLGDLRLAALARDQEGAYVLMHSRGTPQTMSNMTDYPAGILEGIWTELESRINKIKELGLAANNLWIDPGFGFAKTPEQCLELVAKLDLWRGFRDRVWPRARLMIGVSRKRFLQSDANQPWERDESSLRVALNAVTRGFSVVRTHNVALTVAALRRY
jgi:dihydropteroate synthase